MDQPIQFTGKAQLYAKYRPTYPDAYLDYLVTSSQVTRDSIIADIGAGTGILTQQLLNRDLTVIAVEPNEDMRNATSMMAQAYPKLTILGGSAEQTGLADHSVDLITAAQAFHWFDIAQFQLECRRISKPDTKVAIVWNSRDCSSELVKELAALCSRLCPQFKGFSSGMEERSADYAAFYRDGVYEVQHIPYEIEFDLDSFIGRNLSSSYAPKAVERNYEPFVQALTELYHQYARDNRLYMPHVTRSYMGSV